VRVLVTGAGGFLGAAVVAAALEAGHEVLALRRRALAAPGDMFPAGLTWLSGDLRQPDGLCDALADVEGVIHCAAAASGDLSTQLANTVLATENLLRSLPSSLQRFVHVSSFSVYDFDAPGFLGMLSEDTPLETRPWRRDAYTQTKLIQERLVRDLAASRGFPLMVARPGAIYGPGKSWDFGSSLSLWRLDLIVAPLARMRLVHVQNCAEALVALLTSGAEPELTVNLVDAEQPSHWRFHRLARRAGHRAGIPVPLPYAALLALGGLARLASWCFFGNRARLPELLDLPRQRARWRPLRYSRKRLHSVLKLEQRITLESGVSALPLSHGGSSAKLGEAAIRS
jgi:2-alkyl-3-oxoalkanoate reductase